MCILCAHTEYTRGIPLKGMRGTRKKFPPKSLPRNIQMSEALNSRISSQ